MILSTQIFVFAILIFNNSCQSIIDSPCTIKGSGSPGRCRLINDCEGAQEQLDTYPSHHNMPELCGFHEKQPIVCCSLNRIANKQPGDMSRAKCWYYSSFASLKPSGELTRSDECGQRIGGQEKVSRTEFPHMVAIGYHDEEIPSKKRWLCEGILISDQYLLTAATCENDGRNQSARYVKLGTTDLNDNDTKTDFTVAEFIRHPNSDIGLVKLDRLAALNTHARPACLYAAGTISEEKAIATGWQPTRDGPPSDHLVKATLDLVTYESCKSSYKDYLPSRRIDKDTHICAGPEVEPKDTSCQGSTGGPLQIYHVGDNITCMYDIIGTKSFEKENGCSGSPAVYTRVSPHIKWIEDIVWPAHVAL